MSDAVRTPNRAPRTLAAFAVAFIVVVSASVYFVRYGGASHDESLNLGDYPSAVGFGADVGQVVTYGDIIMINDGRQPIVLDSAELLTHDTGAVVEDVRLLDTDAVAPGTLKGEDFGYEPPAEAQGVSGATMLPSTPERRKHYQLIFAVRVKDARTTLFYSVRVNYRISGRKFAKLARYELQICTPKGVDCKAPRPSDH